MHTYFCKKASSLLVAFSFCAVLIAAVSFSAPAFAADSSNASSSSAASAQSSHVELGQWATLPYAQQVTFDLRGSQVDVVVSAEERATLRTQADMAALSWLTKMLTIESSEALKASSAERAGLPADALQDESINEELAKPNWYDTLEVRDLAISSEAREFLLELRTYGAITLLVNTNETAQEELLQRAASLGLYSVEQPTEADIDKVKTILLGKVEEIYNEKLSALLNEKLANSFNVRVPFVVEALAADGSEDATYGVDGERIVRGTIDAEQIEFSAVDFTAANQNYDEVLAKGMAAYLAGGAHTATVLDDGRSLADHLMVINQATIDPLVSAEGQRWLRFGIPSSYYAGLPASSDNALATETPEGEAADHVQTYVVDLGSTNFITGAVFDKHGKLLSLSKQLASRDNYNELVATPAFDALEEGTYRFKLVPGNVDAQGDAASESFNMLDSLAAIDITVNVAEDGTRTVSAQVGFVPTSKKESSNSNATSAQDSSASSLSAQAASSSEAETSALGSTALSHEGAFQYRVGEEVATQDSELSAEEELVLALAVGEQQNILPSSEASSSAQEGQDSSGAAEGAGNESQAAHDAGKESSDSSSSTQSSEQESSETIESSTASTVDVAMQVSSSAQSGEQAAESASASTSTSATASDAASSAAAASSNTEESSTPDTSAASQETANTSQKPVYYPQPQAPVAPNQLPTATQQSQRIVSALTTRTGDVSLVVALIALLTSVVGFLVLGSAKLHKINARGSAALVRYSGKGLSR